MEIIDMKNKNTLSLIVIVLIVLCSFQSTKKNQAYYEKLVVERTGGGDILFDLFETKNPKVLKAVVKRYDFRPKDTVINIIRDNENKLYFDAFHKAMANKITLKGEKKESDLPTGTWAKYFFVIKGKNNEVSNQELKSRLYYLESLVHEKLRKN